MQLLGIVPFLGYLFTPRLYQCPGARSMPCQYHTVSVFSLQPGLWLQNNSNGGTETPMVRNIMSHTLFDGNKNEQIYNKSP